MQRPQNGYSPTVKVAAVPQDRPLLKFSIHETVLRAQMERIRIQADKARLLNLRRRYGYVAGGCVFDLYKALRWASELLV